MAIEAVIFDIGNVLVEWRPERAFDALVGAARRRTLFADVDLAAMNARIDLGEDIAEVVAETAARHPEYHDEILLWHRHWADILRPEITHSARLLRALRRRNVPVYALSNFGISTLCLAESAYPVLTEFDRRFISGHMGVMKPDAAIYVAVERETGHDPRSLFFTDDRPENVAAAAERGWQVHLFDGPDGLQRRLIAEHLLHAGDLAE